MRAVLDESTTEPLVLALPVAQTLDSHPIALAVLVCTPVDDSAPYTASNGYAECSSVSIDSPISDRSADSTPALYAEKERAASRAADADCTQLVQRGGAGI